MLASAAAVSGCALLAGITRISLLSGGALLAGIALDSLCACGSLFSGGSLRSSRTGASREAQRHNRNAGED